ncbi:unnamed protein product [Dovyalis caffra]|uniref:BI1-like protein n=1 Tax=Dovyalis caffra TaxID=77055 RepID=A0AAV1QZE2_9ROSI|nr:unnamed protein product [Dovyalis caffra]
MICFHTKNPLCLRKKVIRLFPTMRIILEAAITTSAGVISLALYSFWAVKRGHDFNFSGPLLFGALLMLIVRGFIQILFPLGKLLAMIYSSLAAIVFCGYIIYDTDNLIKRFSHDEYIWATISLYLDVVDLFLGFLGASNTSSFSTINGYS